MTRIFHQPSKKDLHARGAIISLFSLALFCTFIPVFGTSWSTCISALHMQALSNPAPVHPLFLLLLLVFFSWCNPFLLPSSLILDSHLL